MCEKMDKKDSLEDNKGFNLPLIISLYLILEVIILFVLCLIELQGVNHLILQGISFVLEFLFTLYIIYRSNIRSSIVFYILLLVSPVFLGLIAMGMNFIIATEGKYPFTPTLLSLFRHGFPVNGGAPLSPILRFVALFRLPALMAILLGIIVYNIKKLKH